MTIAKTEAICKANAELNNVGLPTYTELVGLLRQAASLGLNFDIGSAYISRSYINKQEELQQQVQALIKAMPDRTVAHADHISQES